MAHVALVMTANDLRSCVQSLLDDYGYGAENTASPLTYDAACMLAAFIEPVLPHPVNPEHLRELILETEFFLRVPFMLGNQGYETWDDVEAAWSKSEADVAYMVDRIINPQRAMADRGAA